MANFGPRVVAERCPQCGAGLPAGSGDQVVCDYCGSRLIRCYPQEGATAGTGTFIKGTRLKTFAYVDSQGTGLEAFRMLIPAGWQFSGGAQWRMNNPGTPVVIGFQVYNPAGEEAFEVFPNQPFFWTNSPMTMMNFPRGSFYFGNEMQPPAGALQVLREIIVPRFRGKAPGLQLIGQESLPDLPRMVQAGSPGASGGATTADGGKIRIRYQKNNRFIDEEIYGVVEATRISTPGLFGSTESIFWAADYLFSFRAMAGRLESFADLFQAIIYSFRLNPQWYARCAQISQYMIQNQIRQIHNVGQISRIISQTHSQISDMIMDSYNQRQQTMDRISTNFSQAIRGVDEYYDPVEQRGVELPGGYGYAWVNGLGDYVLTDNPSYNPNLGSNMNWQQMSRGG